MSDTPDDQQNALDLNELTSVNINSDVTTKKQPIRSEIEDNEDTLDAAPETDLTDKSGEKREDMTSHAQENIAIELRGIILLFAPYFFNRPS